MLQGLRLVSFSLAEQKREIATLIQGGTHLIFHIPDLRKLCRGVYQSGEPRVMNFISYPPVLAPSSTLSVLVAVAVAVGNYNYCSARYVGCAMEPEHRGRGRGRGRGRSQNRGRGREQSGRGRGWRGGGRGSSSRGRGGGRGGGRDDGRGGDIDQRPQVNEANNANAAASSGSSAWRERSRPSVYEAYMAPKACDDLLFFRGKPDSLETASHQHKRKLVYHNSFIASSYHTTLRFCSLGPIRPANNIIRLCGLPAVLMCSRLAPPLGLFWRAKHRRNAAARRTRRSLSCAQEVEEGLQNGSLLRGKLRINARRRSTAFVTAEGELLPSDIFLENEKARNRAHDGDVVRT